MSFHSLFRKCTSVLSAALLASSAGSALAAPDYTTEVLNDGPLLYWNFNEPSGDASEQVLGFLNASLTPSGNATRAPSGTTFGGLSLGSTALFDGTAGTRFFSNDVVAGGGPGAGFIASQRWAVEFWINHQINSPFYISEMYSDCCSNDASMIHGYTPGFEMFAGGRTGNAGSPPLSPGQWHHVVGVFYGNASGFGNNLREIYIDGDLALADTTSNFSAGHGLNSFAIGNAVAPNENTFSGSLMIDEYAIYELPGGGLAADRQYVGQIVEHYYLAIPEPTSIALLGLGAIAAIRRRR